MGVAKSALQLCASQARGEGDGCSKQGRCPTFFLFLLEGKPAFNGLHLLCRDEMPNIVADTHAVQVASDMVGQPDAIVETIRTVGAFPFLMLKSHGRIPF